MPTLSAFDVTGKTALITGAGRGLGRAMALALAEGGAAIVLMARREADLLAVAAEISERGGKSAILALDVSAADAAQKAVDAAMRAFGRVDILVNNAGVGGHANSLDVPLAEWQRILDVNVTAPFLFSQAAAKQMKLQGGGKIINIASMFGLSGEPGLAAYTASKGALIQLTRTLAVEWARYNIQVNAIAPGYFETDMPAEAIGDPETAKGMLKKIPLRRFGKPQELGPLAVYLSSAASDYVTGEIIVIDGGQNAH